MKKIIIVLAVMIVGSMSSAQTFTFEDYIDEENRTFALISGSNVILEKEGSAMDLYKKTKAWIYEIYKNPEEVIVADSEGEYIKVRGSLFLYYYSSGRYEVSYKFKDGRLKMEIEGLSGYSGGTIKRVGKVNNRRISGNVDLNSLYYKDSKSKQIKKGADLVERVNKYFNTLSLNLDDYVSSKESIADEDW